MSHASNPDAISPPTNALKPFTRRILHSGDRIFLFSVSYTKTSSRLNSSPPKLTGVKGYRDKPDTSDSIRRWYITVLPESTISFTLKCDLTPSPSIRSRISLSMIRFISSALPDRADSIRVITSAPNIL